MRQKGRQLKMNGFFISIDGVSGFKPFTLKEDADRPAHRLFNLKGAKGVNKMLNEISMWDFTRARLDRVMKLLRENNIATTYDEGINWLLDQVEETKDEIREIKSI